MATIATAAKKTFQEYRNLIFFIIFALLQQFQFKYAGIHKQFTNS